MKVVEEVRNEKVYSIHTCEQERPTRFEVVGEGWGVIRKIKC
jgi:hypothetical protein